MQFYDIILAANGRRLMTIEASTAIEAAHRAPAAAPHADGVVLIDGLIAVRPHRPPFTDAVFTDAWFKLLAESGAPTLN